MKQLFSDSYARIGLIIWLLLLLLAALGPVIMESVFHQDPARIDYDALGTPPSPTHVLGTTPDGQDVFAQFVFGARGSVIVGLGVGLLTVLIALVIGVVGAYLGGPVDALLNGVTNVALTLAGFPLLLIIVAYVPNAGVAGIIIVISVVSWPGYARAIRAQTMSLRGRDFVAASRMAGELPVRVILSEVIPHLLPILAAQFVGATITGVFSEAGLAFLGINTGSTVSWGTMISDVQAQGGLTRGMWWWFIPPGLGIAILGTASGLINFGVDAVANPRLRDVRTSRAERKLVGKGLGA